MMGRIFRGKRIDNGAWVYGWYCKCPNGRWPLVDCIIPSEQAENGWWNPVEVVSETVGQYTGLKDTGLHGGDERGNKIFEGDILFSINAEERHYGIVKFGKYTNSHGNSDIGFYVQWPIDLYRTDIGFWASNNCCWIVGNIYDNPAAIIGGKAK